MLPEYKVYDLKSHESLYLYLGHVREWFSHNADYIFIVVLDQFRTEILHLKGTVLENEQTFWKKWLSCSTIN